MTQEMRIPPGHSFALRPRHCNHPDRSGAGVHQNAAAGAGGCAGGIDVVDQQDVAASEFRRARRKKSAAQILATLTRGEPRLACRRSLAFEHPRGEAQIPSRSRSARNGCVEYDGLREERGMIEAALAEFRGVQGHRDSKHLPRHLRFACRFAWLEQRFEADCEQPPKAVRDRLHSVVFQEVDQSPQMPLIHAVSDSSREGRRDQAARLAIEIGSTARLVRNPRS
jgi:hypothetical protein